jgi:hypothetical protein
MFTFKLNGRSSIAETVLQRLMCNTCPPLRPLSVKSYYTFNTLAIFVRFEQLALTLTNTFGWSRAPLKFMCKRSPKKFK